MKQTRRARALAVCSVWLAAIGGCAPIGVQAGQADSPTRGASLHMVITDGQSAHVLYQVEPDGVFSFAGGYDAMNNRPSWSTTLTAEHLDAFDRILRERHWFDGPPSAGLSQDAREHRIAFAWPSGGWRVTTRGGGPNIDPVRTFLEGAARTRHEAFLDRLPKEGILD